MTRTTGIVLVEDTPIRYELEITQITERKKSKIKQIHNELARRQMMIKGSNNISLTTKKTIKWGHIHGVLKGLPVKVGTVHVVWGLKTLKVT